MSDIFESKDAALPFPSSSTLALTPTGQKGVYIAATNTTAQSYAIPAGMQRRFLAVKVIGANARVSTSIGAKAITMAATGDLTVGNDLNAWPVQNGETQQGIVQPGDTHLNIVADSSAGTVFVMCAEIGKL